MGESAQAFLHWTGAHPNWALVILFAVSLFDSLFIIGALVPAVVVLFSVGALVALGILDLGPAIGIATAGAMAGDCISFWLGHYYGERLFQGRLVDRYPEMISAGRSFFEKHGGKSVIFARFLGPMRAVTPAMAGAAGMKLWIFILADGLAAVAWSFAYILPGVVFGASLGLAAEVAGRLAALLLGLTAAVWLTLWLTQVSLHMVQDRTERWLGAALDWGRHHRVLGRFGAALADPDQPETPILAVLAITLLALGAIGLFLWSAPALHATPWALDIAVFQALRDLHTPWGVALASALLQLGEWRVYAPLGLAVLVLLLLARNGRAVAHWLAALGFGAALSFGLYAIPSLAPPYRYFHFQPMTFFSELDLVLATVIYSFLPVVLATQQTPARRTLFYTVSTLLLVLIHLARVYVGAQWFSVMMFSLVMGLIWTGLLGLGYRRHQPQPVAMRNFVIPLLAVFLCATALRLSQGLGAPSVKESPVAAQTLSTDSWWQGQGWRQLASQRQDIAGRPRQPLNLQWAGNLDDIAATLRAAGWSDPIPLTPMNAMHWLTASTAVAELPLLPQVHAGRHQALLLRYPMDSTYQILLRLWPSGYRLDDGTPVWVGTIRRQKAKSIGWLLRYPLADAIINADHLPQALPGVQMHRTENNICLVKS